MGLMGQQTDGDGSGGAGGVNGGAAPAGGGGEHLTLPGASAASALQSERPQHRTSIAFSGIVALSRLRLGDGSL